jgi:hypothetical protein
MARRPPPLPPGSPGAKRAEAAPPTKPSGPDPGRRRDEEDTATSLLVLPSVRSPPSIDPAEVTHQDPVDSIQPLDSAPGEPEPDLERVAATLVEPESRLVSLARPVPVASFDDIETTQITVDLPDLPLVTTGARIVIAPPQSVPPPLPVPPEPGTPGAEIAQLEKQARRAAPLEAARLYARAARLIESNADRTRAIAAYRRVYEIDDSNVAALEALARLSGEVGDWEASAAYRARLAGLATNPREASRAHVAVGDVLAQDARDPDGARLQYERAAALDPKNEAAWLALLKAAAAS